FEERVKARVVIFVGGADMTLAEQLLGLGADFLPTVDQHLQFGKVREIQIGLIRYARKRVHKAIDRRGEGGMIQRLPRKPVSDAAAEMHRQRTDDKYRQYPPFHIAPKFPSRPRW